MIAIRGAIVIEKNNRECILKQTKELLNKIMTENNLDIDDIISIQFSATKDITASYPAPAARELGIVGAALFCVQEMNVDNSLEMCIRTLVYAEKNIAQGDIKHIYLNGAEVLRPDLAQ